MSHENTSSNKEGQDKPLGEFSENPNKRLGEITDEKEKEDKLKELSAKYDIEVKSSTEKDQLSENPNIENPEKSKIQEKIYQTAQKMDDYCDDLVNVKGRLIKDMKRDIVELFTVLNNSDDGYNNHLLKAFNKNIKESIEENGDMFAKDIESLKVGVTDNTNLYLIKNFSEGIKNTLRSRCIRNLNMILMDINNYISSLKENMTPDEKYERVRQYIDSITS